MNRRVAVRAVIVRDGKLLAVRLKKYVGRATDDDNTYWCTPGGGVDVGEPLIPALEREIVEELGVKPVVGGLLYVQQFVHKDTEQLEFFFHVTNADDFVDIDLSAATHGAVEIDRVAFIDATAEHVLPKFLTTEPLAADAASSSAPDSGAPKFFNYIS